MKMWCFYPTRIGRRDGVVVRMFACMVQVVQACEDPGDVGAGAGLGTLRLKNAATPLTKVVVSSGGDGTAMGIEQC